MGLLKCAGTCVNSQPRVSRYFCDTEGLKKLRSSCNQGSFRSALQLTRIPVMRIFIITVRASSTRGTIQQSFVTKMSRSLECGTEDVVLILRLGSGTILNPCWGCLVNSTFEHAYLDQVSSFPRCSVHFSNRWDSNFLL